MVEKRSLLRVLADVFGRVGCAGRVADAVKARRAPARNDLERLGFDPRDFASIGLG